MEILIRDPVPQEFEAALEQRRRLGNDRHDEVWAGIYHVNPAPTFAHALMCKRLLMLLDPIAAAAGLEAAGEFNLGQRKDYRIPDLGLHRNPSLGAWHDTASLVVEVLSPGDDAIAKLPFYARHGVQEVVIVDPREPAVQWLALCEGASGYAPIERSAVIELGPQELAKRIDWVNQPSQE